MSKRSFTLNSKVVNQFILFDLDPKRQTQKQGNKPNDPQVHFHFKFLWRQLFQLPLASMLLYLCTCGQLSASRLCKHFEIIWSSPAKQGNYRWDSKFNKFTAGYSFKVVHFFMDPQMMPRIPKWHLAKKKKKRFTNPRTRFRRVHQLH